MRPWNLTKSVQQLRPDFTMWMAGGVGVLILALFLFDALRAKASAPATPAGAGLRVAEERVLASFKNRWKDPNGDPTAVYIGCPHNTYEEVLYWVKRIDAEIKKSGQKKVAIPVIMACPIVVRNKLLDQYPLLLREVLRAGVKFTTICTPAYQGLKGMADIDRGVTNSNKARYYSRLRLFGDDDLLEIAMTGKIPA